MLRASTVCRTEADKPQLYYAQMAIDVVFQKSLLKKLKRLISVNFNLPCSLLTMKIREWCI